MSEPDVIATLRRAKAELMAGHLDAVVERIMRLPAYGGDVGISLMETARALQDEQDGAMSMAMRRMERVMALDVADSAVLSASARFFHRHGQPALAERALLLRDVLVPDDPPALEEIRAAREVPRYTMLYLRSIMRRGIPPTYPAAPLKARLVRRLGPDGAAFVLAGMSDGRIDRKAARLPLVPLIEHARARGSDHREHIASGTALSPPPPVFGRPRTAEVEAPVRGFFTCVLEDVVVSSTSNVLLTDGVALLDVQGHERDDDLDLGVDPIAVVRDGNDLLTVGPADPSVLRRVPEAIWLTGVHSANFGHWLMEFLPKIWASLDQPGFAETPILVDRDMPSQHLEALRLFTHPEQPVLFLERHAAVRVDRLWVASQLTYLAVGPRPREEPTGPAPSLAPDPFRELIGRALAAIGGVNDPGRPDVTPREGGPRRIYLTRDSSQHRRLTNAEPVEARLTAKGFAPYDFGELPFDEQFRLIRGADHVIGQNGSAMLITLLGRPGLRIGGLAQPYLREWEWYSDACQALGQQLEIVVGRITHEHPAYVWMSDYEIDLADLDAYLEATVADDDASAA